MKLSSFFRKSDRNCSKTGTDQEMYLFYNLLSYIPNNWRDSDGNVVNMDYLTLSNYKFVEREYFHNYSANKESSVLLDEISADTSFATDAGYISEMKNLAFDIYAMYGENWNRLWYALSLKYKPLDNYNGIEKSSVSSDYEVSTTYGATSGSGSSGEKAHTGTVQTTNSDSTYGFNSNTPVPVSTSSSTVSHTGQDAQGFEDKSESTYSNSTTAHTDTTTEDGYRMLEKSGNLGLTTSQQMLNSEADFRSKFSFYKKMFDTIDNVLTCHTFGGNE